ncbi:MAG: DUF5010 C-terminal domain-containing protein, partial [Armatimonadota bacterium]|nr:DUF5010 C-terminal domain-containing protein [Armatimonadota bacterium]
MLASKFLSKAAVTLLAGLLVMAFVTSPATAQLLLDDPLQGSTSGTQEGGSFVSGGWQVTGDYDSIYWHLPYSVSHGAAEFYVTNVGSSYAHKTEHFHMYDYTFGSADTVYAPGYRDNPYKHFIRKSGALEGAKNDSCEIVYQIAPNFFEWDTAVLSWSAGANYKFRVEWGPEGGNSRIRIFRDGGEILTGTVVGNYTPAGHSVRVGCSPRRMGEGSEIGARYSYVKVWDLTSAVPGAPSVTTPANGETLKSNLVFVKWSGDSHDRYQVRACTSDNPDTGIAWDSGEVMSSRDWAWTAQLSNMTNYYVYVRLGSSNGWGGWSAAGRWFRVDNSYNGSNNVLLQGYTLRNNDGPFLGLGFTYMRSLQRCKYDRARFQSDIAAMASKGFKYQRILSMVAWTGLEIAPISFGSVPAWPDYWSQFDYDIDYAYDNYGITTEVTIFADAQTCMPNDPDRYAHMDTILAHCNARQQKIVQIEVANEGWQNGFPDESVTRSFCQYLADRTSIPVSITSPVDMSDAGIQTLYAGSAADISTLHFSRDMGSSEGHWLPVRDCWRVPVMYPAVPAASSNEPVGAGSSVASEDHANHLCAAGAFAFIANLPMYVYHSRSGTSAKDAGGNDVPFESLAGFSAYQYLPSIIPPDVASWIRNDGKETAAPFTAYSMGQANKYWTDVGGATNGCHRNIGARKGIEFICLTQGVLGGGVTLEARQQLTFKVYDPLTGAVVIDTTTKNASEQINLPQGNELYIIWGAYGPTLPPPPGGGGGGAKTLNSKGSAAITIDGATSDWNLAEFNDLIRGGQSGDGDTALVGYDGGSTYYGMYTGVLPTSAADHTTKVYSRNDATYLYFLARSDDNDMQYGNPVGSNWANDCIEFYIDPGNDDGSTAMSNSTSDIQLVIDANNQRNVYMTTSGYATQVLAGVTSAVVRDGTGWWLEARIAKSALDADIPGAGNTIGLDFNIRDNDNNNDAGLTTVYTWADNYTPAGFPSKIPDHWGDCFLDANQTPYAGVISLPGTVQAENYDVGGQNISFNDTTAGNTGGAYRSDDVDIEATTDTGGGYNIGYTVAGEWLEYTVSVPSAGDYSISARVATTYANASFKIQMDGADVTAVKSFSTTGGWQNWTTIIVPSVYLTAGQHIMRYKFETGDYNLNNIEVISRGADAVSIDLGSPDVEDGINHISTGDGDTVPWSVGGHNCRENATTADNYMYFNVTDGYAFQGSRPNLNITFDYYDLGTGTMGLNYDATSDVWKALAGPTLTNSLTWKAYTFQVNDAYFGNRENYGADFRIAGPGGGAEFAIDTVCVWEGAGDTTPPGNVTGFAATPGDAQNSLSWTNPTDPDFTGVKIMWKTTGYPTGPTDGTQCYDSNGTSYNHTGLTNNGPTYYYKAFAHDGVPNYASGAQASGAPVDVTPPGPVTGFAATPGDAQNSLSWTNPGGDFTGTKIMFKTTGYPTGPTDGTQVYDGAGTTTDHTGLTNGTTYYYCAYAHDEVPNYASAAQASGQPVGGTLQTISNSAFNADAEGWGITLWTSGGGAAASMAWNSGAGNPGGGVRCIGGGVTDNADKCYREGGELTKVISTVGFHDIQVSYDLKVNGLGGNYTGAGTGGSCVPDHSLVDEQITVFYSTNGGTNWTEAEYLLRAALLAGYQTYGTRTIDLSAITACDENASFALRFRWQLNSDIDIADLDNIVVKGVGLGDTTPPGNVTGFTATPGDTENNLSWTNPGDADFAGTMIRFRTDTYPTGPADGTQCYSGVGTSTSHTGLTNGTTYYYKAFAFDEVPNYASGAQATATPGDVTAPGPVTGFTATSGDTQNVLNW